jgi:flagellar hook-associated protein 1 FlgK
MSGLLSSLQANSKALSAQALGIATAGRNMANVNNANYARERVVLGDRGTIMTGTGPEGTGVEAMGVTQIRDSLLDQQVLREVSLKAALATSQSGLQNAQAGLGEQINSASTDSSAGISDANGISASLTNFFNSFQSLAGNPTDVGQRQTLIQQAGILTDRIQLTDTRLAQNQSDLTAQATGDVATVNTDLQNIADLNSQIARFEINAPGSATDLRNQRQADLEDLAGKMSFETCPQPGVAGQIQVFAYDGTGAKVVLVDGKNVTGPVTFNGTNVQAGAVPTTLALSGGSIKGALDTRDGAVKTLRNNINSLAGQLVTSVNAAYNPTGATGNFFNPAGTTAASIQLAGGLTATNLKASDGGAAGDNTVALAVANLANRTFSTAGGDLIDGTLSQHYSSAVTDLGQTLAGVNSRLTDETNIETLVRSQRDAVSGVSLDEETADLMKYQRAFQASSRVIQTIDSMLNTVINGLMS